MCLTNFVQDNNSKNGTFLNGNRLVANNKCPISHGDKLDLGNNLSLLLHIHPGSVTCIHCEPAEMIRKLKERNEKQISTEKKNIESERRKRNQSMKTKYLKSFF